MAKIAGLIKQLAALVPDEERANIVIFGSAALWVRGLDLGREPNDLDLFVSDSTYERLKKLFPESAKAGGDGSVPYLEPCPNVEILKTFPGRPFEAVHKRADQTPLSEGFLVGSLIDWIIWKHTQGREKDVADLDRVAAILRRIGS